VDRTAISAPGLRFKQVMQIGRRSIVSFVLAVGLVSAGTASADVAAQLQRFPPPPGCNPVALSAATGGSFCVNAVLVTSTDNANGENFVITDGQVSRTGQISGGNPAWYNSYTWSLGPMTAGQVVTLWGTVNPGDSTQTLRVTRWVERTHGSPALDGRFGPRHPYRIYSALDISRGQVPQHRMVWSLVVPFLELPQTHEIGGDGDVHVQTMLPCPAAGLTTETVPELLGYIDSPYLLPAFPDPTGDAAKQELRQVPPIGVPIVALGGVRYDPGYGWWELHPVRAWRFPTAAELRWAAGQCASNPVPKVDTTSIAFPIPYGFPSCGEFPVEGSLFAPVTNAVGFKPCRPVCEVSATRLDQPETLSPAALCEAEGIRPAVTPSQVDGTASPFPGAGLALSSGAARDESDAGHEQENVPPWMGSQTFITAVAQAYCRQPLPPAGDHGDPFSSCRRR
jgi:hypothetical protein